MQTLHPIAHLLMGIGSEAPDQPHAIRQCICTCSAREDFCVVGNDAPLKELVLDSEAGQTLEMYVVAIDSGY